MIKTQVGSFIYKLIKAVDLENSWYKMVALGSSFYKRVQVIGFTPKQQSLGSSHRPSGAGQGSQLRFWSEKQPTALEESKETSECRYAVGLQRPQAQRASPAQQRVCLFNEHSLKTCYSPETIKHWFYKDE